MVLLNNWPEFVVKDNVEFEYARSVRALVAFHYALQFHWATFFTEPGNWFINQSDTLYNEYSKRLLDIVGVKGMFHWCAG